MDVGVHTLGCKVNQSESEQIQHQLMSYGFDIVDPNEQTADVYVINTCSITISAEASGRKIARRFRRKSPDATIVFTGCYAELHGDELDDELPEVDHIVGTEDKSAIPRLLLRKTDTARLRPGEGTSKVAFRNRKFLKIQDGCRDWCTFCIVPHVRPELHSLPPEDVLRRIRSLSEEEGYGEVVLSGVHLGEYGVDREDDVDLTGLLERIAEMDIDGRVRLSSVEPQDVTERMVELIAESDRFCTHLHMPIQSGADPILDRMQRNYDRNYLLELGAFCRRQDPDFALNTDVMVGFPGETEEHFEQTRDLIEQLMFSRLHVFRYSERPGTAAARMKDSVHSRVRKRRCRELIELGEDLEERFAKRFEDTRDTVLIEDGDIGGVPRGYTRYYLPARVHGDVVSGERVPVRLTRFDEGYFEAEPIHARA